MFFAWHLESLFSARKNVTLQVGDLTLAFPSGSSRESGFQMERCGRRLERRSDVSVRIVLTSATVAPQSNTPATGQPAISGTRQVGETLTADTTGINDADGLDDATFSYQWMADDTNIQDATGSSYTLTEDDEGKTIKVTVSFTDAAGNQESLTSDATGEVEAKPNTQATGQPTIQRHGPCRRDADGGRDRHRRRGRAGQRTSTTSGWPTTRTFRTQPAPATR